MNIRSEVNGLVSIRGIPCRGTPSRAPTVSMAVSVGSPTGGWSSWMRASLQLAPTMRHQCSAPPGVSAATSESSGTCSSSPADQRERTVMLFSVRVPVLSVQITVAPPSVSTAGSRRITARRRAIRETPIARVTVTAAGSPSGIAPTARATAAVNMSTAGSPRRTPTAKVSAASTRITRVSRALNDASWRVSGVAKDFAEPTRRWISPSSVPAPVATTTPAPEPAVTSVPE